MSELPQKNSTGGREATTSKSTSSHGDFEGNLILGLSTFYRWLGNKTAIAIVMALRKCGNMGFNQLQERITYDWTEAGHYPTSISDQLRNLQSSRLVSRNGDNKYYLTALGLDIVELIIATSRVAARQNALSQEIRRVYIAINQYTEGMQLKVPKSEINNGFYKQKGKNLVTPLLDNDR